MLVAALLALAGCKEGGEPERQAAKAEATPSAAADGSSASASANSSSQGKALKNETGAYIFEYSYPAEAAAIPALARFLDADAARARDELAGEAEAAREEAEGEDFPFNQHSFEQKWQVVADLPGWLSLSGDFWTYSGGAHGNYGMESYVWDKANDRGMPAEELFQSPGYLGVTMDNRVCEALNREREKRRGQPVDPASGDSFDQCPELDEATILVGSANGRTFDRITVWFGPYVAGPYAEGAFELDFPMTPAMLEAVKPAYRKAFSAK